jgi:uncharacterized protein (DUF1697 family)
MTVVISLLRGVNVGGHHAIRMEALRTLYGSLGLLDAQTYVQSGNVVFRTKKAGLGSLAVRIESAIERSFGFRPGVILRTSSDLRGVLARNPFANRSGIDPSKLLVGFIATEPTAQARDRIRAMPPVPEELRIDGRELYIYFPNGMARPRLSMTAIDKALKIVWTGRNWNTVTRLLAMAERLEELSGA